jgi:hypothetical protein
MKYTVAWKPAAERELAAIWNTAPDRQAVTDAANALDKLLQVDPEDVGESRAAGTRITFAPPLGVRFFVQEQDRKVVVFAVWRFKKRTKGP